MWLRSNHRRNGLFTGLLIISACSYSALACAYPHSVCPERSSATARQIDIFDGKPEEQAYLAPDDPNKAPNTYTVGKIYDEGRMVVVRCNYDDGFVHDVEMRQRVRSCRYSEWGKKHTPVLTCR